MKRTDEITEEITWLADMDAEQMASIHACMRDYAREVIDEILTRPEMIYDDGEGVVYRYEMFDELKKNLK